MSEININQTDLNITVTPNTTTLSVFTGGYACAQGNTTEVQFNNGGVIAGANGLTYDQGSQTTTAANLTVTNNTDLGAIGNITISGGNSGEVLTTDGSGGLSFSEIANANFASFAGNVIEPAQPNITSLGTLSNLTVSGNVTANFFLGNGSQLTGLAPGDSISNGTSNVRINSANGNVSIGVNGNANILVATPTGIVVPAANLGNVGNLVITGGNNGFVLQTDGTGNLTWTAMTGNAGNGVVGGSNTQVQYNDGGVFGGSAGFTFNKASNLLSVPGNVTASYYIGNGSLLTGVVAASPTSIVNGNSNVVVDANSNVRVSVTGVSNIVDVGVATVTFTKDVEVIGANLLVANANIVAFGTSKYVGNAAGLTNIPAANIVGSIPLANNVSNAAQPNITSLGNLVSLSLAGNVQEKVTANSTGSTGTINFDVLTQSILFKTANATGNFTINVRGNSTTTLNTVMSSNQSTTLAFINTNGNIAYYANNFQIDGTNVTPIYSPGSGTNFGTPNGKDIYTYNIIKTAANTYTVFATIIGFS